MKGIFSLYGGSGVVVISVRGYYVGLDADYGGVLWLYKVKVVVCGAAGKKVGDVLLYLPQVLRIRYSVDMVPEKSRNSKAERRWNVGEYACISWIFSSIANVFSNCFTITTLVDYKAGQTLKLSMQVTSKDCTG